MCVWTSVVRRWRTTRQLKWCRRLVPGAHLEDPQVVLLLRVDVDEEHLALEVLGGGLETALQLAEVVGRLLHKQEEVHLDVAAEDLGGGLVGELHDQWKAVRGDKGRDGLGGDVALQVVAALVKRLEEGDSGHGDRVLRGDVSGGGDGEHALRLLRGLDKGLGVGALGIGEEAEDGNVVALDKGLGGLDSLDALGGGTRLLLQPRDNVRGGTAAGELLVLTAAEELEGGVTADLNSGAWK